MTKMDVLCVSKHFTFMAKTLKNKTTDEDMLEPSGAVIEHHFDNHENCGDWVDVGVKQKRRGQSTTTTAK